MKSVLFILNEYYPYGSAITNCLKPIIEELKICNIKVGIITRRTHSELKKHEHVDGLEIYRVNDYFNIYNNKVSSAQNKIEKVIYKIILKCIWIYKKYIKRNKDGFLNLKKSVKVGLNVVDNYDVIISCSYPFTTHKIAYELKSKRDVKWVAYQFDPHTFNSTLDPEKTDERLQDEIRILSNANRVFLPFENYEENLATGLSVLKEKYYPIEFALIRENKCKLLKQKNNKIIFVYAGTFYKDIRMPSDMFRFFEQVQMDYELHLYCLAEKDVEEEINKYREVFGDRLKVHYNQQKQVCDEAIKRANIIINIGNVATNQTPSKVYEYISMGKPILNFYCVQEDTSKKVLKKYPLVLNIYKHFSQEDVEEFYRFCEINKNRMLSFEEVAKNYKTAKVIASEFVKEVGDIYANE